MHAAAYALLDLDAAYLAFDVPPADLTTALEGLRALSARQLSVSIPHKESILAHLDEVDDTARTIGAVNTVVLHDDRLRGSNTDWIGALAALEMQSAVAGRKAVVLGAGGTARAVIYGLQRQGVDIHILNRTESRAHALADEFGATHAGPLEDLTGLEHDILVNTTSVGLGSDESPVDASCLRPGTTVLDAVYSPEHTRLLRDAESRGAHPISGKWMLIHQAVAQLEAWAPNALTPEMRAQVTQAMAQAFDSA
jgi:shikimate dehydrogenase